MKNFNQFIEDQYIASLIEDVSNKAVRLGLTEEDLVRDILEHYSASEWDNYVKFVDLIENSAGADWGARLGQNIGGFVGGGLHGLASGFRNAFNGGQNQPQSNGQAQQQPPVATQPQQPIQAEIPQLNKQQTELVHELMKSLTTIHQNLEQAGLKGYADYLAKLNGSMSQAIAGYVDNLKRGANLR